MKLILIRHGDAGAYTTPDHERNLSTMGQAQAKQTGEFLKDYLAEQLQGACVDLVIASPYNRAYQTAQVIAQAVNYTKTLTICPSITPDDDAKDALMALDELIEPKHTCIVVVCHMPIVAKLAQLIGASTQAGFELAQASVFDMAVFGIDQGVQVAQFCPDNTRL